MRPITPVEGSYSAGLPFSEEAQAKGIFLPNVYYEIEEICETRKRTGYLLKTKTFQVFLYKSSDLLASVLEAIYQCLSEHPSEALCLQLDNSTIEGVSFAFDEDLPRMWVESKKLNILAVYKSLHVTSPTEQPKDLRKTRTQTSPR